MISDASARLVAIDIAMHDKTDSVRAIQLERQRPEVEREPSRSPFSLMVFYSLAALLLVTTFLPIPVRDH